MVPSLDGDDPSKPVLGKPHEAVNVVGPDVVVADSGKSRPHGRRGRLVAFCHPESERIQQQVRRAWPFVGKWGSHSGLGGLVDHLSGVGATRPNGRGQCFEMRIACQSRTEPFKSLGGTQQKLGSLRAPSLVEGNSSSQLLGESAAQFGGRLRLHSWKQPQRRIERPRIALRLRCRQHPVGAKSPIRREKSCPLQKCGSGEKTASSLRLTGCALEFDGDVFIVGHRRAGPVPSAPIGLTDRICHVGESPMHLQTVPNGRRAVGGGAHQRMTELDTRAEFDQTDAFRRGCGTPIEAELLRGRPQQCRVALRLGRSQRQKGLCSRRQVDQPSDERKFQLSRQRDTCRLREALNRFR